MFHNSICTYFRLSLPQLNVFSGEFLRNAKLEVVHCEDIDDIDSPTKKQEDDFSDAENWMLFFILIGWRFSNTHFWLVQFWYSAERAVSLSKNCSLVFIIAMWHVWLISWLVFKSQTVLYQLYHTLMLHAVRLRLESLIELFDNCVPEMFVVCRSFLLYVLLNSLRKLCYNWTEYMYIHISFYLFELFITAWFSTLYLNLCSKDSWCFKFTDCFEVLITEITYFLIGIYFIFISANISYQKYKKMFS